jgi:hypothetical protein
MAQAFILRSDCKARLEGRRLHRIDMGSISFVVRVHGLAPVLTMKEMSASSMKKISEPPLPSPRSSRGEGGLKGR